MFRHITDRLAKRRARRTQEQAEREQERHENLKRELLWIAGKALLQHSDEYHVEGQGFEDELTIEDAHVKLESTFNPDAGERETIVKVTSRKLGLVLVTVFSRRAEWGHQEWRTI